MSRTTLLLFIASVACLPLGPFENRAEEPSTPAPTTTAPITEPETLAAAQAMFAQGRLTVAEEMFEGYLKRNPRSPQAAQLAYQLGVIQLALDKQGKAKWTFWDLVMDHGESPWAQAAVRHAFESSDVMRLADDLRRRGILKHQDQDLKVALSIYKYGIGESRWTSPSELKSVCYKGADCARRLGQLVDYETTIAKLRRADKDSDYLKLDEITRTDAPTFRRRLEELVKLNVGRESTLVLREQLERHAASLPRSFRARGLFLLALDQFSEEDFEDALDTCERLRRHHARSKQAGDHGLLHGNVLLALNRFDEARAAYLEVARRFPDSPRAAIAKRWADAIVKREEVSVLFDRVHRCLFRQLNQHSGGLAARLRCLRGEQEIFQVRAAWRSEEDYFAELRQPLAGIVMLWACNPRGTYYRLSPAQPIYKAAQRMPLHYPYLNVQADPDRSSSFRFNFGFNADNDGERNIDISPDFRRRMVDFAINQLHLSCQTETVAGKEQRRLILETYDFVRAVSAQLVIEIDDDNLVRNVRADADLGEDGHYQVILSDIHLGEEVPDKFCKLTFPKGVEIKEVEELDTYTVYSHLMRFLAEVIDWAKVYAKK